MSQLFDALYAEAAARDIELTVTLVWALDFTGGNYIRSLWLAGELTDLGEQFDRAIKSFASRHNLRVRGGNL